MLINVRTRRLFSGRHGLSILAMAIITAVIIVGPTAGVFLIYHMKRVDDEKNRQWEKWMRDDIEWRTQTKKRVNELVSRYKELRDKIIPDAEAQVRNARTTEELSEGQHKLNNSQEEYRGVINEVLVIFPQLLKGFDDRGNAILDSDAALEQLMRQSGLYPTYHHGQVGISGKNVQNLHFKPRQGMDRVRFGRNL